MSAISNSKQVSRCEKITGFIQKKPKTSLAVSVALLSLPFTGIGVTSLVLGGLLATSFFKQSSPPVYTPILPAVQHPLSKRLRRQDDSTCKGCLVGVYVTTNETGLSQVREILRATPKIHEGCHIGFSALYNFTVIATRKSVYGLICDFNPHNKVFIEKTLQLITTTATRKEFVKAFVAYVNEVENEKLIHYGTRFYKEYINFSPNISYDEYCSTEEEIRAELTKEGSWLSSDESFLYIQALAKADRIAAITADIRDTKRFRSIATIYQENNIQVDSLYPSNIYTHMDTEEDRTAYLSTIHALAGKETLIIACCDGNLVQKVYTGDQLLASR